ncbi:hypothetical protein AB1N83_013964, partial [Pleurotus pulmonarius]
MARRKASGKRTAALNREASKRGKIISHSAALPPDPSLAIDKDYQASDSDDEEADIVDNEVECKRKRKTNPDEDEACKRSRTSIWRDKNGKTKKARAAQMQPSVATFFKPVTALSTNVAEGSGNDICEVYDIADSGSDGAAPQEHWEDECPMVHDTSPSPAYFDDEMDFPPASSSPEPSPIPAASPSPEPTQNTGPIAVANSQLARNIKQLQKKYQKNELKIPAKAVTKALMDLAALEQYTAHAQGLQAKHDQLRERLKT